MGYIKTPAAQEKELRRMQSLATQYRNLVPQSELKRLKDAKKLCETDIAFRKHVVLRLEARDGNASQRREPMILWYCKSPPSRQQFLGRVKTCGLTVDGWNAHLTKHGITAPSPDPKLLKLQKELIANEYVKIIIRKHHDETDGLFDDYCFPCRRLCYKKRSSNVNTFAKEIHRLDDILKNKAFSQCKKCEDCDRVWVEPTGPFERELDNVLSAYTPLTRIPKDVSADLRKKDKEFLSMFKCLKSDIHCYDAKILLAKVDSGHHDLGTEVSDAMMSSLKQYLTHLSRCIDILQGTVPNSSSASSAPPLTAAGSLTARLNQLIQGATKKHARLRPFPFLCEILIQFHEKIIKFDQIFVKQKIRV